MQLLINLLVHTKMGIITVAHRICFIERANGLLLFRALKTQFDLMRIAMIENRVMIYQLRSLL